MRPQQWRIQLWSVVSTLVLLRQRLIGTSSFSQSIIMGSVGIKDSRPDVDGAVVNMEKGSPATAPVHIGKLRVVKQKIQGVTNNQEKRLQCRRALCTIGILLVSAGIAAALVVLLQLAAHKDAILAGKKKANERKCVGELSVMKTLMRITMQNRVVKTWCNTASCGMHLKNKICKPFFEQ